MGEQQPVGFDRYAPSGQPHVSKKGEDARDEAENEAGYGPLNPPFWGTLTP